MNLKKEQFIAVLVALVVITIFFISNPLSNLFGGSQPNNQQANVESSATSTPSSIEGLQTTDIKVGTGAEIKAGQIAQVLYVGSFLDSKVFDSSAQHGNKPIEFTVGQGQVVKGLDMGIIGMKVGGVRKMIISPELGYGAQGNPVIPANSTLMFEITLVGIK